MNRLITSLILLLTGPSLASASLTFHVTTGSGGVGPEGGSVGFAGNAFSGSAFGDNCTPCANFFLSPGDEFHFTIGDNFADNDTAGEAHMGAVVSSPPLVRPSSTSGAMFIQGGSGPITGPGTYHGSFDFNAGMYMAPPSVVLANPTLGCNTFPALDCTLVEFSGSGTLTIDVVPSRFGEGLEIENESASLTFRTPEPSTTSLLLIGVAGLAVLGRRPPRRSMQR